MIQPTPLHAAARVAAKLRLRERWARILGVMITVAAILVGVGPLFWRRSPTLLRARSPAEREQLLRSGTCIVQENGGALIGKLIGQLAPSKFRARTTYFVEDARVRTTRTVAVSGTRRVPCSSLHEP
jgi:hypothetical protein